jgi:hypothetical protein
MPLNPDSPAQRDVAGPTVQKNLDVSHIHELTIILTPDDQSDTRLRVVWSEGYMEDGKYVPVNRMTKNLSGDAVVAAIGANTTGGSIYGEVKTALWALLQSQGLAPSGNIT